MATAACIAILAAWFVVSALAQLRLAPLARFERYDVFSLLPRWSFFAPRPGTSDYHLLCRHGDDVESLGGWEEMVLADARTLGGAIWNPEKRRRKALLDSVRALTQLRGSHAPAAILFTIPYIAILNFTTRRAGDSARFVQFMIVQTGGFVGVFEPKVAFISDVHAC